MKQSELERIAEAVANILKEHVIKILTTHDARLCVVEEIKHCGVWEAATKYAEGNFVTHAGSTWCAKTAEPQGKPGEKDGNWQLVVKRGKDGKDGLPGKDADAAQIKDLQDAVTGALLRVTVLESAAKQRSVTLQELRAIRAVVEEKLSITAEDSGK